MSDPTSPDIQILHVIYADAIGFTNLSHLEKREFDQALAEAVEQVSHGFSIAAKVDNGDGFALVMCGNPESAVLVAQRLREHLDIDTDVKVRIGLHTGPASLRPDLSGSASITGNAIEQAQRIMGLSNGRTIVCSEAFAHNLFALNPNRTDLGLPTLGVSKAGEVLVGFEIGANLSKQCLVLVEPGDADASQTIQSLKERLPDWNFLEVIPGAQTDSIAIMTRYRSRASSFIFFQGNLTTDHLPTFASPNGKHSLIFVGSSVPAVQGFHYVAKASANVDAVKLQIALVGHKANGGSLGPVPLDSPFYLTREADQELSQSLANSDSVILLKAPTGYGKSSAILRLIKQAREQSRLTITVDLDAADESVLASPTIFYRWLIGKLFDEPRTQLVPPTWEEWLGPNSNLERAVKLLIANQRRGALIVFDGIDRLFQYNFRDDFFGLLRSWHNMRAMREDSAWNSLTMLLAYSSEGQSLVSDVNQSPFNVGTLVTIKPFDLAETTMLGDLHESNIAPAIQELANGHPALTTALLHSVDHLSVETALSVNQKFLKSLQRKLGSDPATRDLKSHKRLDKCTDQRALWSLFALGILSVQPDGSVGYSNQIFKAFFDQ